ncbi:MAG TPA: DUF3352 domain-containing protein [Leptolyngbya sp.]|jgi:hypothetical protein|nr:DUF3352 domain-containing protein [Leptolyngbya sp.]
MLLKRSLFTMLAAVSLITVPALSIAPPKAFAQSETAPILQSRSIASILPAETFGVALINTQDDRWKELSQFQLFPTNLTFPGLLLYPNAKGTSFVNDIQPWLGDQFGIALLSAKSIVMVSSVKDQTALNQYIDRIKASRTAPAKVIQYKGATILEFQPEKPIGEDSKPPKATKKPEAAKPQFYQVPKLAIAVLPGYLINSDSASALEELLDGQGKLADNPKFQRVVQNPKATRSLATFYGKYAEMIKAVNEMSRSQIEQLSQLSPNTLVPPPFDPNKLDPLAQFYDTADGYIWAEPTGMRTEISVNFKQSVPESVLSKFTTQNQILDRLPAVNYMVTNSQNLALYWRVLTLGLESQPAWKKSVDQTRQWMQSFAGIDDRDVFPWMTGEYTVFAYPTTKGFLPAIAPNTDIAMGFMVQTTDRPTAETTLNKLTTFVTPRLGKASIQQTTIAGQPVTSYEAGRSHNFFSYGWTDQNTLLMLFGGGSISEFSPPPTRNLTQSANFKSAIEPFPTANIGYFYVNQGAFMTFVNNSLLPAFVGQSGMKNPFVTQVQDSLASIHSISSAGTITPDRIQYGGFLALAPRVKR